MANNTNNKEQFIPAHIIKELEEELNYGCCIEPCPPSDDLKIHHIDGDQANIDTKNLIYLCAKHREMAHNKKLDAQLLHDYKEYRLRTIAYFKAFDVIEEGKTNDLKALLENGLDPNGFIMSMGRSSLFMINPVTYTTSTGMDTTSCRFPTKKTPLVEAVFNGNIDQVKLLLDYGAKQVWDHRDENIRTFEKEHNYRGNLALGLAIKNDHLEITKMLVQAEKSYDYPDKDHGWSTPIIFSIMLNDRMEHLKVLLEAGADPNKRKLGHADKIIKGFKDGSPLCMAVRTYNSEAVKLLLKYGADPKLEIDNSFAHGYELLRSQIPGWKVWQRKNRLPKL